MEVRALLGRCAVPQPVNVTAQRAGATDYAACEPHCASLLWKQTPRHSLNFSFVIVRDHGQTEQKPVK